MMSSLLAETDFLTWRGRLVRRLRRRHNEHCAHILTYHSVEKTGCVFTDGTGLRHHPAEFERQIDYLVEHYQPIALPELIDAVEHGRILRRAVVLTFDDGYADVLRRAMPVLHRRRVPATVFPVTSVIGNTDLLWQHKLAWLLARGYEGKVEQAFVAHGFGPQDDVGGTGVSPVARCGDVAPPTVAPASRRWSCPAESPADFARAHYRADLPEILEEVLRSTGRSGPRLAASLRPYLEPEDIAEADPELVTFGNHTHTHPILSALTAEQQRCEVVTARDALLALTGTTPLALAYPFGLKSHYDEASKTLARVTGHRAALDMRRRINAGRIDPLELSRKPAPCGSQTAFEKMMEDWPADAPATAAAGAAGGCG